eukprot:3313312-Pyramimonas_sp.AAC.1
MCAQRTLSPNSPRWHQRFDTRRSSSACFYAGDQQRVQQRRAHRSLPARRRHVLDHSHPGGGPAAKPGADGQARGSHRGQRTLREALLWRSLRRPSAA